MMDSAKQAQIDNYLDLYLYAGKIQDKAWQEAIIAKLSSLQSGETDLQKEKSLQQQFIEVNRQILAMYRHIRRHTLDDVPGELTERLFSLKQKRLEISREIETLKNNNQQVYR
ncbi:hypothetical protein QS257_12815 [Terrilactibacillus sp. S3-3]|nr:hypothetical protein QS257_12815 [Terrilactibacillus sp. S3-3]